MYILIDVPTVTATLVSSDEPQAVQVVLDRLPVAADYVVVGSTSDGSTWAVPGGVGTWTGEQVELVDNRAPLNTPVTYVLTVAGVLYESEPVTVPFDGRYLIQSLDGRTVVEFVWRDNGLPQDVTVGSVAFDVPGRDRPAVRFATGGDGGGEIEVRTDQANTARLRTLLKTSRPLVIRTDGQVRDLAPVEMVLPRAGRSGLWGEAAPGGRSMGTDRVWSIPYLLVDDPEPSTPLSIFTWEDFNAAMDRLYAAGGTFDGMFAASSWADFNTQDWDQV